MASQIQPRNDPLQSPPPLDVEGNWYDEPIPLQEEVQVEAPKDEKEKMEK